jgi:uncharacterized protein (DUF2141 family)
MRFSLKKTGAAMAVIMAFAPGNAALSQDPQVGSTDAPATAENAVDIPRILSVPGVPDGACHEGHEGPTITLSLARIKKPVGQFRIELYGDNPNLFLEGKGRIYKYFAPMLKKAKDTICLAVPQYGDYGLLVIHDMDGDQKPDFFTDGFGLSTNPQLALRRPRLDEALFSISEDETALEIKLQYVTGNGEKKRRGSRRR